MWLKRKCQTPGSIMEQQLGEEEFVSHCDKVIDNNRGLEELRAQLQQSGVFD